MATREREFQASERMSDHEALMWNIEKDPWLNPNGASLTLLDRPVDIDDFRRQVRHGVSRIPRLQQRVVPGLGRLATPAWVPDPEFDFDYHFRQAALPKPGSKRQLLNLAARLYNEPLDRTRPLWRFVVIDGLADGSGAIYTMFHHAISDGIGQIRMAELYQQMTRDEPPKPEVDLDAIIAEAVKQHSSKQRGGDLGEDLWSTARGTLGHLARRNIGIGRRLIGDIAMIPADPKRLTDGASSVASAAQAMVSQVGTIASDDHDGSELWAERSRHRQLEHVAVPLADLKAASKALGGSINDAFLVALAEAAVRYHSARGVELDGLNTSFVVSTRTDSKAGGNSFTPVPIHISGAELSFAERMTDLLTITEAAKARALEGGSITNLSGVANLLPTSVVTRTARSQAAKIDFATSNLRGAPFELYCAGARVESIVAMGPLAGTPANITALSYNGSFDIGIFIDPDAITKPAEFRDHIASAFADMISEAKEVRQAPSEPESATETGEEAAEQ